MQMYKKAVIIFALATLILIIFIEEYYNQHKFSSSLNFKEVTTSQPSQPSQQSPSTTTPQDSPTTPTYSQTNHSQPSTLISFQENLSTFEEKHALLSEPLIPVACPAPQSEPQYEPMYNIYPSLQQDFNRTRHPSQIQIQKSTIDRQIILSRRNRNLTTPRVHFDIPSSPTPNPLNISSNTIQSTPAPLKSTSQQNTPNISSD